MTDFFEALEKNVTELVSDAAENSDVSTVFLLLKVNNPESFFSEPLADRSPT